MTGSRRFSQAISEGDGISLVAAVADTDAARAAEANGAEALVVRGRVVGLREATELPILWRAHGRAEDASDSGADAFVLPVEGLEDEDGRIEELYFAVVELGLDCVVAVRDDEELRLALDRVDPEIVLLAASTGGRDGLEHVLALLPDVPAGKLAIAELDASAREEIVELERAGVDGVIVPSPDVAHLVSSPPPEV